MGRADPPSPEAIRCLAARIFGPPHPLTIERVTEGISTLVYRIERGDERFYPRVLSEIVGSFAPEVRAHASQRAHGVRVPEVVYSAQRIAFASLLIAIWTLGRLVVRRPGSPLIGHAPLALGRDLAFLAFGSP